MNIFQNRDEAKRLIEEIQNITELCSSGGIENSQISSLDQKVQDLRSIIQTIHNQSYVDGSDPILQNSRSLATRVSNALFPTNTISNLFSFFQPKNEAGKMLLNHVELLKEDYSPAYDLKSWISCLKDLVMSGQQKTAFDLLESTTSEVNLKMGLYIWAARKKGEDSVVKYVMENFSSDKKALFLRKLRSASPQEALVKSLINHIAPFSKIIQDFVENGRVSRMILDVIDETKIKECTVDGSTLIIGMTEKSVREVDPVFIQDFILNKFFKDATLIKKALIGGVIKVALTTPPRIEIPEVIEITQFENPNENKVLLEFPDPSRAIGIENLPGPLDNLLICNVIYPGKRAHEDVTINLSSIDRDNNNWNEEVLHGVKFGFKILDWFSKTNGDYFK